ncbi:pirin family protein [Citromicrobium sp. WPS32]|uniref:pirin family protein n=1 Tax=Citromicrobium sp. WPS32 TaxID=1634517 RepID=UPI0006C8E7A7|nr:pirin family protein [Citromicrobium sp. WPS32]KPM15943.1 nuclease PIN [Citromicrobium sp. WPS32]|tara:strand:- start:1339 stop:2178 length:840 start_codon:yes stop_codon:yes gene_type:complete
MSSRQLLSLHRAMRDDIQDLTTRRPVPGPGLPQVDPFLFLNHHGPQTYPPGNRGLPFGPHPHRGFETVTFILEGSLAHHDSGSGASVVEAGGVQWMTAGSGLVHAELSPEAFKRTGGPLEILQLWVNLPARLKMSDPAYIPVSAADIAATELGEGVSMRAVSGTEGAPIHSLTDVMLAIVEVAPGGSATLPAPAGRNVFFYTVEGEAKIGEETVPEHTLAQVGDGDGLAVASENGCRILFGHADPIGEPVVAHGPFVMNSEAEIAQAIRDYQAGKFGGL